MEREIRDKWIEALRSGKYEQCQKILKRDDSYCCLGVLGVIGGLTISSAVGVGGDYFREDTNAREEWKEGEELSNIPDTYPALGRFGLTDRDVDTLINMNDRDGKSFEQIADFIEQNF